MPKNKIPKNVGAIKIIWQNQPLLTMVQIKICGKENQESIQRDIKYYIYTRFLFVVFKRCPKFKDSSK